MTAAASSGAPRAVDRVNVLFVDDDPLVLRAVARAASDCVAVTTAASAGEALLVLRDTPVDIVVSDLELPDFDGIELLSRVRREHPRTIRMMLTGSPTLDRAISAINEGELHRFFVKPLDLDVFARVVGGLGDRIAASRLASANEGREARRKEFFEWVHADGRPLALTRSGNGEVVLDVGLLESSLQLGHADDALALLGAGS